MNQIKKRGSLWLIVGELLIAAALLLSGYNLYEAKRAEESSFVAGNKFSAEIEKNQGQKNEEDELFQPAYVLYPEMEMPIMEIDGEAYVGYLEVPQLELSLPVIGGEWEDAQLKKAPCLYAGSVYMKNMIVVGHNYRSHFSKLKTLDPGAEIFFTDAEGNRFDYVFSWMEIIDEKDVEAMEAGSEEWDLTLFTCTYGGNERYTLRCIQQ